MTNEEEEEDVMNDTSSMANAVLMGGGHAKSLKFDVPGTTHEGTICAPPEARQERDYDPNNPGGGAPKFFPSGDPIMGVVVTLQTDERIDGEDDGKRTFYVEGRYVKEAVRNAVRAAGASGLEVGGRLKVTFTHREDPMDKRSRKYWEITYTPAGNAVLMGDAPTPAAPQAPAPTPAAPQEPAPAPQQAAPAAAPAVQWTEAQIEAARAAGVSLPGM